MRHGVGMNDALAASQTRRRWWRRPWGWMLVLLLGWLGWVEWQEYDFRGAVREAEAAGFDFQQSPGPIALIRADWHAAFRWATWRGRERKLRLPEGCDLAPLRPLLLRLHPTTLNALRCRNASAIRGLTGLHELGLYDSDVNDLAPLAGLKRLQQLSLNGCTGVTNLAPLAGLTQLQFLYLTDCTRVADIAPLAGLVQLEWLDLLGCMGVSAEAKAAFRKRHPKTIGIGF